MALSMRSVCGAQLRGAAARPAPFKPAFAPIAPRAPVVVVRAAEGEAAKKKAAKKRTPAPVKRAMIAEERRMYNKARKSACATRIKKVIKVATPLMSSPPGSEEDIKPLEKLISEAYQEIDKAVVKGILHKNNAARKKARVARYKRMVLISAGLFKPSQDHPDYAAYQRIQAKKQAASA